MLLQEFPRVLQLIGPVIFPVYVNNSSSDSCPDITLLLYVGKSRALQGNIFQKEGLYAPFPTGVIFGTLTFNRKKRMQLCITKKVKKRNHIMLTNNLGLNQKSFGRLRQNGEFVSLTSWPQSKWDRTTS